jgi:hypothetical protein
MTRPLAHRHTRYLRRTAPTTLRTAFIAQSDAALEAAPTTQSLATLEAALTPAAPEAFATESPAASEVAPAAPTGPRQSCITAGRSAFGCLLVESVGPPSTVGRGLPAVRRSRGVWRCRIVGFAVWPCACASLFGFVGAFCASASPRSRIVCNGFGGLSRRERCLDKPPKPLKAARIGVRQKEWMTRICREFGLGPLGAWGAAGWQPALVRPAAGGVAVGCAAWVGSLLWFDQRPAFGFGSDAAGRVPTPVRSAVRAGDWVGSKDEQPQPRHPPDPPGVGCQLGRRDRPLNGSRRTNKSRLPTEATRPTTTPEPAGRTGVGCQSGRRDRPPNAAAGRTRAGS